MQIFYQKKPALPKKADAKVRPFNVIPKYFCKIFDEIM